VFLDFLFHSSHQFRPVEKNTKKITRGADKSKWFFFNSVEDESSRLIKIKKEWWQSMATIQVK